MKKAHTVLGFQRGSNQDGVLDGINGDDLLDDAQVIEREQHALLENCGQMDQGYQGVLAV